MYEAPKLTRVGRAEDVVLGVSDLGGDLDAMIVIGPMEFEEESLPEE